CPLDLHYYIGRRSEMYEARQGNGSRGAVRQVIGWAVLLGLATAGCTDKENTVRLEVYSWWSQEKERGAFDAVVKIHHDDHPNVEIRNLVNPDSGDSREELAQKMLAGAPPATFQANVGADVLQWAVVDTVENARANVDAGPDASKRLISGLDALYAEELAGNLPPEIEDQVHVDRGTVPFAVPINIHRLNVLYYNKAKLTEAGGTPLLTLEKLCPADPTVDPLPVLIAVAPRDRWTLTLFVFEVILVAVAGPDAYEEVFKGRPSAHAIAKVREALVCARYLSQSFTVAGEGRWADAVSAVRNGGGATFTVMGDWANGPLKGALENEEVVAMPFPGTKDYFVFTSDSFPLPLDVEHPQEALDFLRTIASRDAQIAFSEKKGSIPARMDVPFTSPRGWATHEEFASKRKVVATSGLFPPYFPDLGAGLEGMMFEPDTNRLRPQVSTDDALEATLREFLDAVPLLERWQRRLASDTEPPAQ
ncbi:MAG TPA: ABC transporter substrate-binding protein, partial [Polyangiaceae bacterium]|nr:ABC transporter substrate-binding protein [Polyangiaceae bacterium]